MTLSRILAKEHIWFRTWAGFDPDDRKDYLIRLDIGVDPADPKTLMAWLRDNGWKVQTRKLPRSTLYAVAVESENHGVAYDFPAMPISEAIMLAVLYAYFYEGGEETRLDTRQNSVVDTENTLQGADQGT